MGYGYTSTWLPPTITDYEYTTSSRWTFGNGDLYDGDGGGGVDSVGPPASPPGAGAGAGGTGGLGADAAPSTLQSTSPTASRRSFVEKVFEGGDFSFYPERRKVTFFFFCVRFCGFCCGWWR